MAICTAKFPCTMLEGQATNSDKEHSAGGDQFVFPPVMERPAFPTPLESQRVVKRGKTDGFPNGQMAHPGSASSTVAGSSNERRASLEHNHVDPLVVGKSVQDVAVRTITQGGNHKATLIVEEGQDLRMHAGGDIVNASGGKSKRKTDVSSKGLRIQKRSEFKIPTKLTLAEWMSLVPEKPVRSSVRDVSPTTHFDHGLELPIVKQSVAGSSLPLVSDPVIDSSLATDCDMQV
ncbi:hypothetical protein V6N12_060212 [Hibiscus sabdariffa]|uniref:Uncharacterized protein n=1 Tax=Hibiscus sabdariffa TaxID=183260 RepID=A0ABR2D3S5_9ROSI